MNQTNRMNRRTRTIVVGAAAALLLGAGGAAAAAATSGGSPAVASPGSASAHPTKSGQPTSTPTAAPTKTGPTAEPSGTPVKTPTGSPGTPDPRAVHVLAGILGVSDARAGQVLEELQQLAQSSRSLDPDNPQVVALAASLHLTGQQLLDDLQKMKEDLIGSAPQTSSPGKN